MAEAAQNRVKNAMEDFIRNVEFVMRPIEKQAIVCQAQCLDDSSASMEEVSEVKALTFFKLHFVQGQKVYGQVFRAIADGSRVFQVRAEKKS